MNKIKAKTLDDYLSLLGENQAELVLRTRAVILETIPNIEEKISYHLPFFYYFGPFCYLNSKKELLHLGLTKGYLLKPQEILKGTGKKVRHLYIETAQDLEDERLKLILKEAAKLNKTLYKK